MRTQLPIGIASTLEFTPAEGPPTSPAVTLPSWVASSPTPSVDTGAAIAAAVIEGATTIEVDDASGLLLDRDYWLCTDTGRCRLVRVIGIDTSSNEVELEQPAAFAVTTSGTLSGAVISVDVLSTDLPSEKRLAEARWSWTVRGRTRYASQRFDVVARPWSPTVTEATIERIWPGWGEYQGNRGAWRNLLDGALDHIAAWLEARRINPDEVHDTSELERAAAHIVVARAHIRDGELYQRHMDAATAVLSAIESARMHLASDEDDTESDGVDDTESADVPPVYMRIG